ncbi:HRDC domain-containing protein [Leadbettera azotonutricia]|uniref:Putative 3'-5' exonuclease n=1 Tax=Leadbettera azotonutricia (strain ATCC BAA-888 / DSM 13862 / ZAS-9) TaxID=545695 RepID=F5YF53_LEAAZ|nr:ribonuclease D [Leadbettera azotonutricia]AEF81873.1 putative 3'-5' exonuclease [Leadbettera azotonutricia ZAS-9]
MDFKLIETGPKLSKFYNYLANEGISIIAMDFECEFNLHAYGEKLCLIQIFDGKTYFIIDPLNIENDEIKKFLLDKNTVKIMYGAESDASLVYSQYGTQIQNLFDLQIAVDVLDAERNGLDFALDHFLDIEIKNKKKYQSHNWTTRPIRIDAMEYALNDVAHLFKLKDILMEQVKSKNKYEELLYEILRKNFIPAKEKIPGLLKRFEYKKLSAPKKELFKKLFDIRESFAKEYDLPPFHILNNDILFDLVNRIKNLNDIKLSGRLSGESQDKMRHMMEEALRA